jgi:hypothetical protein
MSIILDSMRTLLNIKQKEHESFQDYTKRFKTSRDVMRLHIGGPIILTKFVKKMKGYDATTDNNKDADMELLKEKAFNQLIAYTYLDNADKAKYGTLLTGLHTQKSLKNDQYSKSITKANNVLRTHRFYNASKIQNH